MTQAVIQRSLTDWATSLAASGHSRGTISLRVHYVSRLLTSVGRAPWSVTARDVEMWLAGHEWKPSTRRSAISSVREYFKWVERSGGCARNPAVDLRSPREPRPCPKPLPEPVLAEALRKWEGHPWVWLLRLAASTGLRRGELSRVHSDDVEGGWLRVVGKGGVVRRVPVSPAIGEWLVAQGGWAFPSPFGGHVTDWTISDRIERMTGFPAHRLRHRYATEVYRRTGDLRAVQELLGHASVATTQRYVAVGDEAMELAGRSAWVA